MSPVRNNVVHLLRNLPAADEVSPAGRSIVVPVDELLTPGFISRHTRFSDFGAMLTASDFGVDQIAGLELNTDPGWEAFIRRVSRFSNWGAMLKDARGEWIMRRLGLCGYVEPLVPHRRVLI